MRILARNGLNMLTSDIKLFYNRDPYYRETSPLIFSANQWTGFYMIETSVMKELRVWSIFYFF